MNMKISPIGPKYNEVVFGEPITKEELDRLERMAVRAAYYKDGSSSLAPNNPVAYSKKIASKEVEEAPKKSVFKRFSDWISGVFGFGPKEPEVSAESPSEDSTKSTNEYPSINGGAPKLEDALKSKEKLRASWKQLNDEIKRLEEDAGDFEKQLLGNPIPHSKILLEMALAQKRINENRSLLEHDRVRENHDRNKELHKTHFTLKEAIEKHEATGKTLKWINIGTVAAGTLFVAGAFATGGLSAIVGGAMGAAAVIGGSLKVGQAVNNYTGDKKTGELSMIGHRRKTNGKIIQDGIERMGETDQAIAQIIKAQLETNKKHNRVAKQFTRVQ